MRKLPDAAGRVTLSPLPESASTNHTGVSIQRQEAAQETSTTARRLFVRWALIDLDDEGLGRELAALLPGRTSVAFAVLELLPSDEADDVAQEIVIALGSRLGSVDETLRMRFVWEMVYGTVTDSEEGAIAQIWESFGERLPEMAARYARLWVASIDESDQLNDLPLIVAIREGFENDVIGLASNYLSENEREIRLEKKRLGIQELFSLERTGPARLFGRHPGHRRQGGPASGRLEEPEANQSRQRV